MLMQTHPSIVGLARIGDRFGVRCLESEAASCALQRCGLTRLDCGCTRVDLGPSGRNVRSSAEPSFLEIPPPMDSLHAASGEIIFHEVTARAPVQQDQLPVLASCRTLQGMSPVPSAVDSKGVDPLQNMDPWQAALDRSSASKVPSERSVLCKLKASAPDTASSESIEASIMARVESRIASSHGELDAKIHALDSKVGQVAQKVDCQETLLQSLFAQQMSRIEELIGSTKKPRAE